MRSDWCLRSFGMGLGLILAPASCGILLCACSSSYCSHGAHYGAARQLMLSCIQGRFVSQANMLDFCSPAGCQWRRDRCWTLRQVTFAFLLHAADAAPADQWLFLTLMCAMMAAVERLVWFLQWEPNVCACCCV